MRVSNVMLHGGQAGVQPLGQLQPNRKRRKGEGAPTLLPQILPKNGSLGIETVAQTASQKLYAYRNRERLRRERRQYRKRNRAKVRQWTENRRERFRAYLDTLEGRAANRAGVLNTKAKRAGLWRKLTKDDLLSVTHCHCGQEGVHWRLRVSLKDGGDNVVGNVEKVCNEHR